MNNLDLAVNYLHYERTLDTSGVVTQVVEAMQGEIYSLLYFSL